jgi:uncharacterized membrane protein
MNATHLTVLILPILLRIAAFALIFAAIHRYFARDRNRLPGVLNRQSDATGEPNQDSAVRAKPNACERAHANTKAHI